MLGCVCVGVTGTLAVSLRRTWALTAPVGLFVRPMAVTVQTAAFRSRTPYHFAVPFSYVADCAVASVPGSRSGSSALFDGFERTAIALFSAASESENDDSSLLLRAVVFVFELV